MSQVFDFSDVDGFCPRMFPTIPTETSPFFPRGPHVDVYFFPRKRSRIAASFVVPKKHPSIEVLPDECLFEILRRLPGSQERSACASVSRRWLTLLSTIQRNELCASKTAQSVETVIQSNPREETNGSSEIQKKCEFDDSKAGDEECQVIIDSLSRCLEGKKANDVRLAAIAVGASSCGGLGKLSIRGSASTRGLTNFGLKAISRGCPGLRVLSLWNLSSIGDEGIREIASGCHYLEKIDLNHCPAITDKGLIAIAMNCSDLTSITVESCLNIGNDSLQALGLYCPNLKCITIRNCPLVSDKGIGGLFSTAGHILMKAKLEALSISDVSLVVIGQYGSAMTDLALVGLQNVTERGFWVMGKGQGLKRLRSLSISACRGVSDLGIEALGEGCPNLKIFVLKKCSLVSDRGLVSFAKGAESLESLQLGECHGITQRGVFNILANCCKKLKALALEKCLGTQDTDFRGFQLSCLCLSLRSLTVCQCPGFGDAGLGLLGRLCPKLTQVDLNGLKGITDAGILPLFSKTCLVKVNLTDCVNLTDNAVLAIANFHGETLDVLNLDGCGCITDVSLVALARKCTVITELDVSRCRITDSGISALAAAGNINLRVLGLGGCSLVSAKCVPFLVELGKFLVGLNVQRCRGLSSGAVDQLLDQLWRCDILS